jgi:hypothetical protein
MFPGRHWQQICCSARLYDGVFGEGSLRASANQARALTWTPGLGLDFLSSQAQAACRACAQLQLQTTRDTFSFTSPLPALWFTTLLPFLSFHVCGTYPRLAPSKNSFNASRSISKNTYINPTASPSPSTNMAYRVGMYLRLH